MFKKINTVNIDSHSFSVAYIPLETKGNINNSFLKVCTTGMKIQELQFTDDATAETWLAFLFFKNKNVTKSAFDAKCRTHAAMTK